WTPLCGVYARRLRRTDVRRSEWVRSGHHAIAGHIGRAAGELHAGLLDEGMQQAVQRWHDRCIAMDFVRPMLFDQADALVLHVTGDDPGERSAQIRGQRVWRKIAAELQAGHVFMGWIERTLEAGVDFQQPVEVERIVALATELL